MSRTVKHITSYNTRTNKFKSNRYSGYANYKMKPFGLHHYRYSFQKWNFNNRSYLGEDVVSVINKSAYRRQLKNEIKRMLIDYVENT